MDLETLLADEPPAFALLHRPRSGYPDRVEILCGEVEPVGRLADLPLPPLRRGPGGPDLLALLPYRQLTERGLACYDDGAPLLAMPVRARGAVTVAQALKALPDNVPVVRGGRFDPADEQYTRIVRRVVADEVGRGEGSNFVIRRTFQATVENHCARTALAAFRRLLRLERGGYWTFLVHWPGRTLLGASPERHVSLLDGVATMHPISGTYRYPPGGPTLPDLMRFLGDGKEAEELYMVVDEELKMLGRVCDRGARISGPRLTEMAHLAHTEYTVAGRTDVDVRVLLRETMFSPAVIGSPLANACRVVAGYERRGRGYYGGVLALLGQRDGRRTLDSSILIRTAELSPDGGLELGVGTTLVRRSDPAAEAAETRAKARSLLVALGALPAGAGGVAAPARVRLGADRRVVRALAARNDRLSRFWCEPAPDLWPDLSGQRILVVDAGDAFTTMLGHQVRALGAEVTIREYQDVEHQDVEHQDVEYQHVDEWRDCDAVVVGPGPGDPCAVTDPKIAALRELTTALLVARVPILSVCLGHQVLAGLLGLPVRRRGVPAQGEQREIDFFGRTERVAFYNTFAVYSDADRWSCPLVDGPVEVCRDRHSGEVYGLRATGIRSVQFHPESLLTQHGVTIVRDLMTSILPVPARAGMPTWPPR